MSDKITPRVATSQDEAAVTGLLKASYSQLMPASYDEAILKKLLPLITQANSKLLASGTYFIAQNNEGLAVGCGGWTLERPGAGNITPELGHIRHFATHPDWIGHSIGRKIYDQCEEMAKAQGVKYFECYSSLNAKGFYQALGFEKIALIDIPIKPGLVLPSIHMKITLL
ncbi:MAG: GNAT family N-acetyltransferase [Rhodospirillales bacterium]|nr:GNAT family N-acetyltransferase [Rhodospirillales bacterium]